MSGRKPFFTNLFVSAFIVAAATLPGRVEAALQSESFYDAQVNASQVNPGSNTIFGQFYVGHIYTDDRAVITPFKLPYIAPGQTITSASVSWNYAGTHNTPTTSVDVYGLTRIATSPTVSPSDFYIGPNDLANTLLQQGLITPATAPGTVTCSNANLASWLQTQYAAFTAAGTSDLATRYVFLRLNGNAIEGSSNTNYLISTPDNYRPLIPTLTITVSGFATPTPGRMHFQFYTPTATITSAAVYQNGGMVRSLWNNAPATAGNTTAVWDGNDDFGNPLPTTGSYTIKVATNGVTYQWDGAVGNTSLAQTGTSVHRSLNPMIAMDVSGNNAYFAVGYNEQQTAFHYFPVGSPQSPVQIYNSAPDPFSAFTLVAADNTTSYWAKTAGGVTPAYTYVIGLSQATHAPVTFSAGGTIPASGNQKYSSAIDLDTSTSGNNTQPNPASGLAVQKNGSYLFVCHSNLNLIRVFDKATGGLITTISDTAPGLCATDPAGNLYVLSGTTLQKFVIGGDGNGTLLWTTTGLTAPVGLGCDPTTNTVTVADNNTVEAFDSNAGGLLWTYGSTQTAPDISNSAFLFGPQDFIAYQPDGTFWVGDQGNQRYLHFSVSSGTVTYLEQISYNDSFYTVGVDPNAITHVFANFLEYQVDYTKPLGGCNGSWTLLNNWAAGLPNDSTHNYIPTVKGGIANPVTLSNGRRYALLLNFATNNLDLYELTAGGVARFTGETFGTNAHQNYRIYGDGTLRFLSVGQSGGTTTVTYNSEPLSGFDASNNPQWGSPAVLCSFPLGALNPQPDSGTFGVRVEQTAGGLYPVYGSGWSSTQKYHLGMVSPGATSWQTQTMLNAENNASYTGRMPRGGLFDSGNKVQYAGNVLTISGANIFLGYHGELWKNSEASTFFHFLEDGLMMGSFGVSALAEQGDPSQAISGYAGNNFCQQSATDTVTGISYIYTNDESQHGGPNRWSINNLSSVAEISATGTLGSVAVLNVGPPTIPGNLAAVQVGSAVSLNWSAYPDATSFLVERSSVSGGPYLTIAATSTGSYTDTNVTPGSAYYYVVLAKNSQGQSPISNEASLTILTPFQQVLQASGLALTTSPSAIPDNDGVSVLLKYATGLAVGTPSAAGPAAVSSAGDHLILQFNRLAPAPVTYYVEASGDLVNWSALATLAAGATSWTGSATVAETGTGPVAVTVTDPASLSAGTAPRFLRLRVALADGTTEPGSLPAGDVPVTLAGNGATSSTSLPLDNPPVARNAVQAVASGTLTVASAGNWATAAAPYALRLLSGQSSGRTFPITTVSGNALGLATQGVDLTQCVAVGDLYEILPLDTLASLYGPTAPLLSTGPSAGSADNLALWTGTAWLLYYNTGTNWRQAGSFANFNNLVVPPGGGYLVIRRGAGAVKYQVIGRVPEVALSQWTAPGGIVYLGAAYPLAGTLGATGFAAAPGWQAGPSSGSADDAIVWNGTNWIVFYYTGTNWRQAGSFANFNSYPLAPGQPIYVQRRSNPAPLNAFIPQPIPYTP